jgi:hypothetical protein
MLNATYKPGLLASSVLSKNFQTTTQLDADFCTESLDSFTR